MINSKACGYCGADLSIPGGFTRMITVIQKEGRARKCPYCGVSERTTVTEEVLLNPNELRDPPFNRLYKRG